MTDTEIDAVENPATWDKVFDDRSRAVLTFADAMCGETSELPSDLIADLQSHFSEPELAEIVLVCGQANLNNRVGNAAKQLLGP